MAESRCNRCHRKLKTPEAIAVGLGSACYKKVYGKTLKQTSRSKTYISRRHKAEESLEVYGQISIFELESEV